MSNTMIMLILSATWQTIYMVFIASLIASLVGIPLGILLAITSKNGIYENKLINSTLGVIVNAVRSIPFIILLVAIIPFTRLITGTSIGTAAAIVPLTIGAIPFIARIIESAIHEVSSGLIEAGIAMGANNLQIILKILLPESLPSIIDGITVVMVSLVGYSAMAGVIGGGGLGEVAINYGYQRFDPMIMLITVVILIIIVQFMQVAGENFAKYFRNKTKKGHAHV